MTPVIVEQGYPCSICGDPVPTGEWSTHDTTDDRHVRGRVIARAVDALSRQVPHLLELTERHGGFDHEEVRAGFAALGGRVLGDATARWQTFEELRARAEAPIDFEPLAMRVRSLVEWVRADPPQDADEHLTQFGLSAGGVYDRGVHTVRAEAPIGSFVAGRPQSVSVTLEMGSPAILADVDGTNGLIRPFTEDELRAVRATIEQYVRVIHSWGAWDGAVLEPGARHVSFLLDITVGSNILGLYQRYVPFTVQRRLSRPPEGWR